MGDKPDENITYNGKRAVSRNERFIKTQQGRRGRLEPTERPISSTINSQHRPNSTKSRPLSSEKMNDTWFNLTLIKSQDKSKEPNEKSDYDGPYYRRKNLEKQLISGRLLSGTRKSRMTKSTNW